MPLSFELTFMPSLATLFVIAFVILVTSATLLSKIPHFVASLYFILSLITFMTYAFDKSAAKKRQWQIPEKHLHLLSLLGGWPGAAIAQQQLRHKSSKRSFQRLFWLTMMVNSLFFVYFLMPQCHHILTTL
jgi:uncharacterized membrane protein YsdA (DUF1294 family)